MQSMEFDSQQRSIEDTSMITESIEDKNARIDELERRVAEQQAIIDRLQAEHSSFGMDVDEEQPAAKLPIRLARLAHCSPFSSFTSSSKSFT
jgi:uncharacterized coiled-coil protein SlyX